jgi:putative phage-type endonuclease
MKILNVKQGTPEWHEARACRFTASEAPVMMGVSKHTSRDELIRMKATGSEKEVSDFVQKRIFDKGHAVEDTARTITEELIGEDLYPVTGVHDEHDWLLASFDGMTIAEDFTFEHKQWNEELASAVESGDVANDPYYWVQLEQQCFVAGIDKTLFVVSDGTKENRAEYEYQTVPGRMEEILAGWEQFKADVEEYKRKLSAGEIEPEKAKVTGSAPGQLPYLNIEVTGMVTNSNLSEFKSAALSVIGSINTKLVTDEDFADAVETVKWCQSVEDKLKAAKEHALGQTVSISELFRAIDEISEQARQTRLKLDKLVKSEKESRKLAIIQGGMVEINSFLENMGAECAPATMPPLGANLGLVIKGLKSLSSMQSKVNDKVAELKIEARKTADTIKENMRIIKTEAEGFGFLFNDYQDLALKDHGDLSNLVKCRVDDYKREKAEKEEREKAEKAAREESTKAACEEQVDKPREKSEQSPTKQAEPHDNAQRYTSRTHQEAFKKWWWNIGSGIKPLKGEDHEEFAERMSALAWDAAIESVSGYVFDSDADAHGVVK